MLQIQRAALRYTDSINLMFVEVNALLHLVDFHSVTQWFLI